MQSFEYTLVRIRCFVALGLDVDRCRPRARANGLQTLPTRLTPTVPRCNLIPHTAGNMYGAP